MIQRPINFVAPTTQGSWWLALRSPRPLAAMGLAVAALGAGILWPSKSQDQQATLVFQVTALTPDPTPILARGRAPQALSPGPIVSLAADTDRDSVRYYATDGRASTANLTTASVSNLSEQSLPGFLHSIWVPRTRSVISAFETKRGIEYRFFDYVTREVRVIGSDIAALTVSPDGRNLALVRTLDQSSTLMVSDVNGDNARKLMDSRTTDVRLDWPRNDLLSLGSRRPDRAGADLSGVGLDGSLKAILSNRENLEYVWSPNGNTLLYSYFVPGYGIQLFWKSPDGGPEVSTGIATSAAKCAWLPDSSGFVCGVPSATATQLPRDIAADRAATTDDIVRFTLATQEAQTLFRIQRGMLVGVIEPVIPLSGNAFAFRNLFDRRLWFFGL